MSTEDKKTPDELVAIGGFGVYVTSTKSKTHISIGGQEHNSFIPCGLSASYDTEKNVAHPNDEIVDVMSVLQFKEYVKTNRNYSGDLSFCKRCLKYYDQFTQPK